MVCARPFCQVHSSDDTVFERRSEAAAGNYSFVFFFRITEHRGTLEKESDEVLNARTHGATRYSSFDSWNLIFILSCIEVCIDFS